jgi:ubiquinone/menaquinone biosynthesis C-methylase UbiE
VNGSDLKQCCARLYESELVSKLLGDSFHPGGAALTERLGQALGLAPGSVVLDAASGTGTSAILIAQRFECSVVGIDLGAHHVNRAAAEVDRLGLAHRIRFDVGDAERLPVEDASVDAVICECAFCTFPDKAAAAREFARVLKPGGRLGLSDITRLPGPPEELTDLMAWIACLADARPAEAYASCLVAAGFRDVAIERHDEALADMVRGIGARLFASEVLAGLDKIDLAGFDIAAARRLARQALTAIAERRLGYAIVYGTRA